jgi:2'-hydroxyisoflavone reductase
MRILMVGGTRFIGRHVVEAALTAGHDVTLFHRGRTGVDLFPDVEHRLGDRDSDLSGLADGEWDATVDTCAYVPRQVQTLADALGGRGGHHLLVSSVSAYSSPEGPGLTEDAPLAQLDDPSVEEVTDETYGGLKVLCELAAVERHGPDTLLVRPTYVVGPDDYTWRFPWWVTRLDRGGEVLVPGPLDAPAQVIDVRDMASWMVTLLENGESGAFHAVSPEPGFTWQQQIEAIANVVAPAGTGLTWVDSEFALDAGLGDGTLPLWSGNDADVWTMAADPTKAYAAGLSPRPLADTIRDTLAWTRTVEQPAEPGLSPDREQELLAAWHSLS